MSEQGPGDRGQGPGAGGQEDKDRPDLLAELGEERRKREGLEKRVNELMVAAQASEIRGELQKLGVVKVELAYRAVKDDVYRSEDGRLLAHGGTELTDYLTQFVGENPELLPARLSGGSGASGGERGAPDGGVDLSRIRPGMSKEEMDKVRQEIARVAARTLRGL